MEEIRGPAGRTMWDKLGNVNETVLANYLKNEYPQTVAVVLSKIKPEHAARVLARLPEEFALEVVQRMLRMESVQKDILDKVERTLRVEFMSNLARTAKRDAHEHMAEIFNNFDRQTESRFITALEERSRDCAERIKALMFTFEDLGKLDPGSIQTLLRHVEKDKLALALKGATDTLRDVFFSNMSRARRQDPARRHGGDGPGAPQGRRGSADAHGQRRQGPCEQGRDHDRQQAGRRRAGLLMRRRKQIHLRHRVFATGRRRSRCRARAGRRTLYTTERDRTLCRAQRPRARHEGRRSARRWRRMAAPKSRSSPRSVRDMLDKARTNATDEVRQEASMLALAARAQACARGAIDSLPVADVEAALREALHQAIGEPRIVLSASHACRRGAQADSIGEIAHEEGFDGRVADLGRPRDGRARTAASTGAAAAPNAPKRAIEAALAELIARRFQDRADADGGAIVMAGKRRSRTARSAPRSGQPGDRTALLRTATTTPKPRSSAAAQDLEAVYDVPVTVSAVLGKSAMEVSQLLKLGKGTIVELDRKVGEAIDIYVNDRLVARGEVVLVDDRLGVTMTEIIKAGQA